MTIYDNTINLLKDKSKNLAIMGGGTFAVPVATLLVTLVITRSLTSSDYGSYIYLISFINLFIQIANFGVYPTIRFIAGQLSSQDDKRKLERGLFSIVSIMSIAATCFALLGVIVLQLFDDQLPVQLFLYACLFVFLHVATSVYDNFFQGVGDILRLTNLRLYPKISFLMLVLGILWLYPNVWVAFTLMQVAIFLTLFFVVDFRHLGPKSLGDESVRLTIEKTKTFGINVYLGSITFLAGIQCIPIAIASISSDNSYVGYYGLAMTLTSPLVMFPQIISTVFFRDFVSKDRIDKELIFLLLVVSVSVGSILYFSGAFLIEGFFGEQYLPAVDFFEVLILFNVLHGINVFLDRFLHAKGAAKVLRDSYLLGGLTLFLTLFVFISQFDVIGVCWALLSSSAVSLAFKVSAYLSQNYKPESVL